MPSEKWYFVDRGKRQGPVAPEALGELLASGKLGLDTQVWTQGLQGWMRARDCPELLTAVPPPLPPGTARKRLLGSCDNCESAISAVIPGTLPWHDDSGRSFCSRACRDYAQTDGYFCADCMAQTTAGGPEGGIYRFGTRRNGTGRTFRGKSHECPVCHSVIMRDTSTLFFLPVSQRQYYRVLWTSSFTFFSRRLKDDVAVSLRL